MVEDAQLDTPTPTPTLTPTATLTPTPAPYVYMTLEPDGQAVQFEYTATAGDVAVVFMLVSVLFSVWIFGLISLKRR